MEGFAHKMDYEVRPMPHRFTFFFFPSVSEVAQGDRRKNGLTHSVRCINKCTHVHVHKAYLSMIQWFIQVSVMNDVWVSKYSHAWVTWCEVVLLAFTKHGLHLPMKFADNFTIFLFKHCLS